MLPILLVRLLLIVVLLSFYLKCYYWYYCHWFGCYDEDLNEKRWWDIFAFIVMDSISEIRLLLLLFIWSVSVMVILLLRTRTFCYLLLILHKYEFDRIVGVFIHDGWNYSHGEWYVIDWLPRTLSWIKISHYLAVLCLLLSYYLMLLPFKKSKINK
jgi:hypothetical protein